MNNIYATIIFLLISSGFAFSQTADEYYQQAEAYYNAEQYKKAEKALENAIELNKDRTAYYKLLTYCHYSQDDFQKALDVSSDAIARFPDSLELFIARGTVLTTVQEFKMALHDYNTALELASDPKEKHHILINRSATKSYMRDFEGAYHDLKQVIKEDSTNIGALINLGAICDEIGRGDETLKYLYQALEVDSTMYSIYVNIGFKHQEMGEYKKAVDCFDKVIKHNPEEALAYSNRSYNRLQLGDVKGAMKDIEKSIDLYPSNPYAYKNRALIYIEKGKMRKACKDLQTAIDKGFTRIYGSEVVELQAKYCND